ncbi:hypothetical protein JX265_010330 [Neoarthrinium moseri]|uniref:Methyltransferase domain-containing protein n=1 Tax=Neoarthrinium moseri TaxID=1658444 RepID=A0A9P9WDY4_9PEZI|nr:hypothetical protein JX265_010330 [Neoarthrinium moseri]
MENTKNLTIGHVFSKNKSVGWYDKTGPHLQPEARELLERYSGIPSESVLDHILAIRDQAWEVYAYPCIGQFRFLDLSMIRLPIYPQILSRLKSGAKLLDVGCCLAQDIRKLVYDGAPADSLYGAEQKFPFIDVGYDLFKDRATLKSTFMQADILEADPESPLNRLKGSVDIIHLGMILHVFNREEQLIAIMRCVDILKQEPGTLIVGQAVGHTEGKLAQGIGGSENYFHSDKTFTELMVDIEAITGAKFRVEAGMDAGLGIGSGRRKWDTDDKTRRLFFEVERIA